ncbi:glycosyltransferase family 4 protein [Rossellomorea marisflavi]|uniref:glycosyltransferase family 4 protein n=1 Tax=Rossellomorea marisflavi TaxID=189381 RepID=UPI001EE2B3A3|nr:glycosyltransferase family 4 protein [Rossellomorea marisflavi]UKS67317.1 glycosyltransferase family 4 protein [Rossellomorea marisflavi]
MKILLVSYYPLPYAGGIWTVVSNLQQKLLSLGHQVDLFSQRPDLSGYRMHHLDHGMMLESMRPKIMTRINRELPFHQQHPIIQKAEIYRLNFEMTLREYGLESYDVIHAQDVTAAQIIGSIKPAHIPLVTSAHGSLTKEIFLVLKSVYPHLSDHSILTGRDFNYYKRLEKEAYKESKYIHTQSKWMKSQIETDFRVNPIKVISYPLGIHNKQTGTPVSKKDRSKVLIFSGRVIYLKGITFLLEALSQVELGRQDWECLIVGDGDYLPAAKALAKRLRLNDRVSFLGHQQNMEDILAQGDLLIQPSLQDTQPLSVVEGQFAGLPAIVSDAAGLPEMIQDGLNGLIVPTGDAKSLQNAIEALLNDDDRRCRMGQAAIAWANERWTLDAMVSQTLALYKRALT